MVDSNDDGTVTFALNHGNLPELRVSAQYEEMARAYKGNKASMNRREKEALLYAREKVERAQGYIEAVKQRRHTLFVTMKAIIAIQHRFFVDGDEADLRPMTLKGCRRPHRAGYLHHQSCEQHQVCPDALGHVPIALLLYRRLRRPIAEKNSPPATSKWRSRRS